MLQYSLALGHSAIHHATPSEMFIHGALPTFGQRFEMHTVYPRQKTVSNPPAAGSNTMLGATSTATHRGGETPHNCKQHVSLPKCRIGKRTSMTCSMRTPQSLLLCWRGAFAGGRVRGVNSSCRVLSRLLSSLTRYCWTACWMSEASRPEEKGTAKRPCHQTTKQKQTTNRYCLCLMALRESGRTASTTPR